MKKYFIQFLLLVTAGSAFAQNNNSNYKYSLNLNNVADDKLQVTLLTPGLKVKETVFHLPKMVPGTYAIADYGRYISDLKAFDHKGNPLKTDRTDSNSWKITEADRLAKITYIVDDSWDSPEVKGVEIFQPAGTNIDKDKMFVINNFGFFGYFDGQKSIPFEITVTKPADFYGSTSLKAHHVNATTDHYSVPDYYSLADAPMMYNRPDTTTLNIGGTEVLVSIYSPNQKATSAAIAKVIRPTLEAQKEYLGGKLPVDKYAFIIALTDNKKIRSYGALEHSYSSLYFLPEYFSPEKLAENIKNAGSHEFFHIVTPLSIHSHEIGEFDYDSPKMSEHLWMYEGLTEYAAHHMQVKYGIITFPEYLKVQTDKLDNAMRYNDTLAFTKMSKGVLDTYEKEYGNVYEKGALIGLCLDIKLRQLSKGKYGTQNLMADLSKTYGKTKSFNDDELFATITKLTYPEIGEFLNTYVSGTKKLPYKEIFAAIGVDYEPFVMVKRAGMGKIGIGYNGKSLFIAETKGMNDFGKKMGYQKGDVFISINGKTIPDASLLQQFLTTLREQTKEGDQLTVVVSRKDSTGRENVITLSQPVELQDEKQYNVLKEFPELTAEQAALRKAWLNTGKN
ncbi:putative metalloprotease with PDZ domain [Pedobacter cryoconitis]|uniref:M61 family metallopeptidase n=1 Tax=Pedobacter cryoconitis TaxID=188932 RepID=UPI00160F2A1C|nr:peptidase M61 [Pedobacter cryoconitis]MBB6274134.1 putative metalloprotease with PDZ domain [Pedobacter cryoconitis]